MLSAIHEENENEICTWLGLKWLQKLLKRFWSSKIMFWLFLPQLRELVELTCAFFTSMPGRLDVQRAQSFINNQETRGGPYTPSTSTFPVSWGTGPGKGVPKAIWKPQETRVYGRAQCVTQRIRKGKPHFKPRARGTHLT